MPLLAMNLSDKLFLQIKELVEKGAYQNPESFLEIAAFNQLALERGVTPDEVIARGHRKIVDEDTAKDRNGKETRKKKPVKPKTQPAASVPIQPSPLTKDEIADTWSRLTWVKRTELSAEPCKASGTSEPGSHVFGQVNRLFPLKLACRWLAHYSATIDKWPTFDSISGALAEDAGVVGSYLEQLDTSANRKRDEVLSIGLPRRGNTPSKERFLAQFLARVTRAGLFPTTIAQYQLAKFEDGTIALTEQGLEFASFSNPILDGDNLLTAKATLSKSDSEFLVRLVLNQIPVERDDMQVVLRVLAEGKVTPAALSEGTRQHLATDESDDVFKTQVSGIIARLSDLGLVRRRWEGRFVTYELENKDRVEAFLKVS